MGLHYSIELIDRLRVMAQKAEKVFLKIINE